MTTRNAAAAAAADALSKAGPASVLFHKSSNSYFIRCAHYNTKGVNGVRKEAHGYPTKADAEAEVDLFRFAVHHDGGRTWQNWSKRGARRGRAARIGVIFWPFFEWSNPFSTPFRVS